MIYKSDTVLYIIKFLLILLKKNNIRIKDLHINELAKIKNKRPLKLKRMNDKKSRVIIIGLLYAILIHNLYINFELLQIKKDAEKVKNYSNSAEDYASEAAYYAKDAADVAFVKNFNYCP